MQLLLPNLGNFPVFCLYFKSTYYLLTRGVDIEALVLVLLRWLCPEAPIMKLNGKSWSKGCC
jgi:hypothetical protein